MRFPTEIQAALTSLTPDVRAALQRDYAQRSKTLFWAYFLWGVAGGHYVYLRQRKRQVVFLLTLGGFGVWWILDAVRIPGLVARVNEDIARTLVAQYQALMSAPAASSLAPRPPASVPLRTAPDRGHGAPVATGRPK